MKLLIKEKPICSLKKFWQSVFFYIILVSVSIGFVIFIEGLETTGNSFRYVGF